MIPRLHATYGPADSKWGAWEDVPARWLRAYLIMLPRVEAERSQAHIREIAAGSGTMNEQDQKTLHKALERDASGGVARREKPTVESMRQLGIAVVTRD
jgi:hypothetical protein